MNPDFQFADPRRLGDSSLGALDSFIFRVWTQSSEEREQDHFNLSLELDIALSRLKWIGSSLDEFAYPFPPNTVIFRLRDGFYTDGSKLPANSIGNRPHHSRSATAMPVTTSSFHELMKLNNVSECIEDALRTRSTVMKDIENLIVADKQRSAPILQAKNAPLQTKERLDAVHDTRRQVKKLKAAIAQARELLATRRSAIAAGEASISVAEAELAASTAAVTTLTAEHATLRPQLTAQLRRIASTLLTILPIAPISGAPLHFTIGGLYLPSAAAFSRASSPQSLPVRGATDAVPPAATDDATAAALGHVVQVVQALAAYLQQPLPFALFPQSSTSAVFDPLTPATQLGLPETPPGSQSMAASSADPPVLMPPTPTSAPSRLFALAPRTSPAARFAWAVYLVNKDLEELMGAAGLRVVDPRATAANLKYLLEALASGTGGVGLREAGTVRGLRRPDVIARDERAEVVDD